MTEAIVLALIAIVGSVITALFKLLSDNTKATSALAESNRELVAETRKGNKEAAERNGHLGEQNENITRLIISHAEDSQKIIDDVIHEVRELSQTSLNTKQQNVEYQHIEQSDTIGVI